MIEIGLLCRIDTTVLMGQISISGLMGPFAPAGSTEETMQVVAILNQKGGSGKTTTAVNLAAALGELGQRVLIVDLDPQASASGWCGVRDGGSGLFELFANYDHFAATSGIESLIRPTP